MDLRGSKKREEEEGGGGWRGWGKAMRMPIKVGNWSPFAVKAFSVSPYFPDGAARFARLRVIQMRPAKN